MCIDFPDSLCWFAAGLFGPFPPSPACCFVALCVDLRRQEGAGHCSVRDVLVLLAAASQNATVKQHHLCLLGSATANPSAPPPRGCCLPTPSSRPPGMGLSDIHRKPGLGRDKQRHLLPLLFSLCFYFFNFFLVVFWFLVVVFSFCVLSFYFIIFSFDALKSFPFMSLVREDRHIEPR